MSTHETKTWLVAYDICEPKRLRRVHQILRKTGLAAQYSAFTVEADDAEMKTLLETIEGKLNPTEDDLRAYHLPVSCPVWRLGSQTWPDGITMAPAQAARLLMNTAKESVEHLTDYASDDQ